MIAPSERRREREEQEAGRARVPTFEAFAEEWFERRRVLGGSRGRGLSASGERDLSWRLDHLRAWFGSTPLDKVTEEEVERYATAKRDPGRGRRPRRDEREQDRLDA